jgi:hypothetical protein
MRATAVVAVTQRNDGVHDDEPGGKKEVKRGVVWSKGRVK